MSYMLKIHVVWLQYPEVTITCQYLKISKRAFKLHSDQTKARSLFLLKKASSDPQECSVLRCNTSWKWASLVSNKSDEDQCPTAYISSKASHIALQKKSERKPAREFLKLSYPNKSNLDWWMSMTKDFSVYWNIGKNRKTRNPNLKHTSSQMLQTVGLK